MRKASHDTKAGKQTVSLTINSDLYARAKRLGINASKVAEQALGDEVARRTAQEVKVEIQRDLEASDAYAEKHGSFADLVRDHYQGTKEG
jgi:post-segregation antitoxin (ccd killing protein)